MQSIETNGEFKMGRLMNNNHRPVIVTVSLGTLLVLVAPAATAHADIFQWEYINPADPSQGKQPSTMLCVGGAGANAAPGTNLSYRNLTMAYLTGADISGALANAVNLTNADLSGATLVGANLTGANLSQANLMFAQLY